MEMSILTSAPTVGPICHNVDVGQRTVRGYGNTASGVVLIGIAPGKTEVQTGRPFTGVSGKLLDGLLEACGWHRDKVYTTNLLCWYKDKPEPHEILDCWPRLCDELEAIKPRLIVPLGMLATAQFCGTARKFGAIRGTLQWNERFNCYVLPTFHPAAVYHAGEAGYGIVRDIVRDLSKIATWIDSPNSDDETGTAFPDPTVIYQVMNRVNQVQTFLDSLPSNVPVALDVETFGKDEDDDEIDVHTDDLLCLAISDGTTAHVITPDLLPPTISWPTDIQWTGHFSIFDKQAMMRHLPHCPVTFQHDTLNMHYCLDERSRGHRLKELAREYQNAGFYEQDLKAARNKGQLDAVPLQQVMEYNAKDTAYTAREANRMLPLVEAEGMSTVYNLLMKASDIFAHMQYHGVYVSVERLNDLALEWIPLWIEKEAHIQNLYRELSGTTGDINLNSPKQLSRLLFNTLKLPGGPSTAEPVIEALKNEHPFVDRLLDFREMDKLITVYINGVRDDIKRTGRIHPTPKLHGTNSGRLSYSKPPVQTIPRPFSDSPYGTTLRRIFTAKDDDHVIIEADLRQAEVWMAQHYSQDQIMLEDLLSGDFHTQTAMFITGKPANEVTKAERSDAKRMTFGRFFLIGDAKFAKKAKKTVPQAYAERRRWEARYSGYVQWTKDVFLQVQQTGEQRTIVGRAQRYPYIFDTSCQNKIVNMPIQSTSHDVLLAAIVSLYWPLRQQFDAYILLDVHDAMLVECPRVHAMEAARLIHRELTTPRFGLPSIPAEVKIGPSWGEVIEVEL